MSHPSTELQPASSEAMIDVLQEMLVEQVTQVAYWRSLAVDRGRQLTLLSAALASSRVDPPDFAGVGVPGVPRSGDVG